MMDYKEIKRKEVLFEIIDDVTNGMDIYNHNGSLWIINTKELKWVVEFTNDKTLWYNYNLFKNLFKAISLDVSENQKYITEWFESRFLNVYTVKTTVDPFFDQDQYVKETIQNGVKDTKEFKWLQIDDVEDTIQNGVKRTVPESIADSFAIADTIQNGVKHTDCYDGRRSKKVDDTIQNGVKQTELSKRDFFPEDILQNGIMETIGTLRRTVEWGVDDIIQNGVKHTEDGDWLDGDERFINIIQNGVKQTHEDMYHHKGRIGGVIKNGVKELQPLPAQDGNMDWGNYYNGKEDRTKTFNSYLNDTITYGKKIIKNDK
jgi:hypothetical protein